jgi:hypothetical protein
MVAFSSILLALSSASAALASPLALYMEGEKREASALEHRSTPSGTGTNNGFFYSFWTDNQGQVTYNNGAAGSVRHTPFLTHTDQNTNTPLVQRPVVQRRQLRRRQRLEPRRRPQRDLQRYLERRQRQLVHLSVRLDAQPAHRVLHR